MTARALVILVAALLALPATASAAGIDINAAGGKPFPDRAFVLTLPQKAALSAAQVQLTENGRPVHHLQVTPGDQAGPHAFGVVLAIDASQSMNGAPIADAMAAARQFATQRSPNTQVGVVFFNHGATVALPLTADQAKIDQVLAQPPTLAEGTRIFDAASESLQLLKDAGISAGSVVVLSDGADAGSRLTASTVTDAARRTGVRLFTVGLHSPSYRGDVLRSLADVGGGTYAEAASSQQLRTIYGALAERFGRQYLVSYQSLAALGSTVSVHVAVNGVPGAASATYQAPAFLGGVRRTAAVSGPWGSTLLEVLVAAVAATLAALALYLVIKPRKAGIRERVGGFVKQDSPFASPLEAEPSENQLAKKAEARLASMKWWARFVENCDVGRVPIEPVQLVALTALGALLFVLGGLALGNPGIVLLGLLVPVGTSVYVQQRAARQRRAFAEQLPDTLQVIASAMRAGHSFVAALSVAKDDAPEPSARELAAVVRDEQLGMPLDRAAAAAALRMRSEEFEYVGLVAMLQRETGGNTAEVLDQVTETIRERMELRRMVRTLTAQGRFSGVVVSALPVVLAVAILVMNKGYLDPLLHQTSGRLLLGLAAGLVVSGWLVIRRIVDIKV